VSTITRITGPPETCAVCWCPPTRVRLTDTTNAPLGGQAALGDFLQVHRLEGTVEAADTQVHDTGIKGRPIVGGPRHAEGVHQQGLLG
jgi:hypothetical protein